MATIPNTSISMLKAISSGTDNVRWTEFFRKYELPMRGFLRSRFPSVEPEDAMQETMIALIKALPNYCYTPDKKGHFRNYLMGILAHKAADILKKNKKLMDLRRNIGEFVSDEVQEEQVFIDDDELWKISAMEAAIEQLLSDNSIQSTTREVFRHVALMHEDPKVVAQAFGISRNNVDQIKNRMIKRLADMVKLMTE